MSVPTDVPSIVARLDRLERSATRYRIATLALLVAFIAVASVATVMANSAPTQTIRHLRVVDARGIDRVDIDQDGIAIADSSGVYRQVLTIDSRTNAPVLEMRGRNRSPLIDIVANPAAPFIRLLGNGNNQRIFLGLTDTNSTLLEFDNASGRPIDRTTYSP